MSELVLAEQLEPGIVGLALNRAERRNALCIDLLDQLHAAVTQLEQDRSQRVLILRGEGPVFSAGLDLSEAADPQLVERSAACVDRTLRLLRETSLATIAEVHGGAFAGGAGMMASCDIVIASDDVRIGFPEARRGLLPAVICEPLRHKVREGDLRELFLAGDPIDALRAQQVGLVQRVVSRHRLHHEAMAVARSILAGGPDTIRRTKHLLNELFHPLGEINVERLLEVHREARHSPEAEEGLRAFFEKREPTWEIGQIDEPAS